MTQVYATLPDVERLHSVLAYDPISGVLFWKHRDRGEFKSLRAQRAWNARYAGKPAGSLSGDGYTQIIIDSKSYLAHRVIWKMQTGRDPQNEIDHENHIRRDNRWANLRDVTSGDNNKNASLPAHNRSSVVGVGFMKAKGKWRARIGSGKQVQYLGLYSTFQEAVAVRKLAEKAEGFHENHGLSPVSQLNSSEQGRVAL